MGVLLALGAAAACSSGPSAGPQGTTSSSIDAPITPSAGGTYRIASALTGMVLDVDQASLAAGARIQQWPSWDGPNQHWTLKGSASTGYELIAAHSGSCLDVPGWTHTPGAALEQWPCLEGANQRWRLVPEAGKAGWFSIVGVDSGLCLDVRDGSDQAGAIVQQWGCSGSGNQHWRFEPVGAPAPPPNVFATSTGTVEIFLNGTSLGATSSAGAVLSVAAALTPGENTLALRATAGAAVLRQVEAQVGGAFGTVGTSTRWVARGAEAGEATGPGGSWTSPGYDDGAWPVAVDVGLTQPAPFPQGGPARGIWSANTADAVVLFRTTLYIPAGADDSVPQGFGRGVTGGAGGEEVEVSTLDQLAQALCATQSDGACTDTTPRIVHVPSQLFDFTGTEGSHEETGCVVTQCAAPIQSEYILNSLGACNASGSTPAKPMFDVTVDNAGTNPLLVGSNKTILGEGAGATLRGKGLSLRNVSNVVVRNLTITGINPRVVWGGDAITLDGVDRVWIDHDRFSLIGRQMLVTGFGAATNVTVSANEFDGQTPYGAYCDGKHYWVMLVLGQTNTMTVVDNWIHDTSGRGPHAGGMMNAEVTMHLANNLYETIPGFAANPETPLAKLLLEGNQFTDVTTPVLLDTTGGLAFAPTTTGTTSCASLLGRSCVANVVSPAPTGASALPLDLSALTPFSQSASGAVIVPYPAAEVVNRVPHLAGPGHL